MGVFNPEPSLTSEAFWAERIFPTHPPSEASAPPERQRGVLRWLLLETVPDHIPERFRHMLAPSWPRAVADLKTKFSDFAPYFLRPFRTTFGPYSEEIRAYVGLKLAESSRRFENNILGFCTLLFETVPDHIQTIFQISLVTILHQS